MTDLVYVYAIVPRPITRDLTGIDDRPVRFAATPALAAAVSGVPESDFEEEALNANVKDMGWLGPRAVAHQDVNARLFELSHAIVPLAFGTVFRDDARVRAMLSREESALRGKLEAVSGCAEWVVAVHLLREPATEEVAAVSPQVRALRTEVEASRPGRAHLLRRRLDALARDEARRLQGEAADDVLSALHKVARDVFREPLPSDTVERPLLRASILVPRQEETTFMDEVDRLRERWPEPIYRLLLTGPWPPYRFGGLSSR